MGTVGFPRGLGVACPFNILLWRFLEHLGLQNVLNFIFRDEADNYSRGWWYDLGRDRVVECWVL